MKISAFEEPDRVSVIALWRECGLVAPQNDPHKDIDRKLKVDRDLFLVGRYNDEIVATVMGGYEGHRGWINYLAGKTFATAQWLWTIDHAGRGAAHKKQRLPQDQPAGSRRHEKVLAFYAALGYGDDNVVGLGKRLERDS
jgi:hypothetical protein